MCQRITIFITALVVVHVAAQDESTCSNTDDFDEPTCLIQKRHTSSSNSVRHSSEPHGSGVGAAAGGNDDVEILAALAVARSVGGNEGGGGRRSYSTNSTGNDWLAPDNNTNSSTAVNAGGVPGAPPTRRIIIFSVAAFVITVVSLYYCISGSTALKRSAGSDDDAADMKGGRAVVVILSAMMAVFLNAGLSLGFPVLMPTLTEHEAFHDLCPAGTPTSVPCFEQTTALTGMFSLSVSMMSVVSLPTGFIIDAYGPKRSAVLFGVFVAVGVLLFAQGGSGTSGHLAYRLGFFIFTISGPRVYLSAISFGNLIPGREGLITSALTGSFDASASVFLGITKFMKATESTFETTISAYAAAPIFCTVSAYLLWPNDAVEPKKAAGTSSPTSPPKNITKIVALDSLPLREQLLTKEFFLMLYTNCVGMTSMNFFIGSVAVQLKTWPDTAPMLTTAYASLAPCLSVLFVPVIGFVIDTFGIAAAFVVLWLGYIVFSILWAAYLATGMQVLAYASFIVLGFCKPLFFTSGATYIGKTFGFHTFGQLYGILITISGLSAMVVQPLIVLGQTHSFFLSNGILSCLMCLTIIFPVVVLISGGGASRVNK